MLFFFILLKFVTFFFFFFFNGYGHHRDLHSFPTRRSSDLASGSCPSIRVAFQPQASKRLTWSTESASRSEEHTSELQSQFHLVCRLLLEKKKNGPKTNN